MLKGNIYVLTDQNMVMELAPTHLIICVSEDVHNYHEFIEVTKASMGSILLPSYEASCARLDGNMEAFKNLYFNSLSGKEASNFMAIILRALFNGKNIILYLSKDEAELGYINLLMEYFLLAFGLSIGYNSVPCSFDIKFVPVVLNSFFMYDLISVEDFIFMYPDNTPFDPMIVIKLANVLNPPIVDKSLPSYTKYFMDYKKACAESNMPLIVPIRRV